MLVRLFGENFRSLKSPFELSLVAADFKREEDRKRGVVECKLSGSDEPLRLLRVAAVYGPNASGKSTILLASRALNWLATESSQRARPGSKIPPYEPFELDPQCRGAPIHLGCDVVHRESVLRYQVWYTRDEIQRETLDQLTAESQISLIDREASGEVHGSLLESSEANRLYVKEMQPNVSVLSKLAQHGPHRGEESARPFYRTILQSTRYEDYSSAATGPRIDLTGGQAERFADDKDYRRWIMTKLIQPADIGICDVETSREPLDLPDAIKEQITAAGGPVDLPDRHVVVNFVHAGLDTRTLDFAYESAGTQKLYHISDDWWALAFEHITLFADELGASLHPRLLNQLVSAINRPVSSDTRSQLVLTTHETSLLESLDGEPPALRRDQVYFMSKTHLGESKLFSLAEFKEEARPVHNIRKRYMSGQYGALPSVEGLSL